jgi:NADH-quinone oxidoreductase subunit J
MEVISLVFWFFVLVTCVSAVLVATSPKLIHSVFGLFFCFFGVAGLYVILGADFLAATQVILYIGGILVLLIFGVMLTNRITEKHLPNEIQNFIPASILCLGIFYTLCHFPAQWREMDPGRLEKATFENAAPVVKHESNSSLPSERVPKVMNTTLPIGNALLSTYLIPFELASIVLLVAMLGAASIARKEVR